MLDYPEGNVESPRTFEAYGWFRLACLILPTRFGHIRRLTHSVNFYDLPIHKTDKRIMRVVNNYTKI